MHYSQASRADLKSTVQQCMHMIDFNDLQSPSSSCKASVTARAMSSIDNDRCLCPAIRPLAVSINSPNSRSAIPSRFLHNSRSEGLTKNNEEKPSWCSSD